MVLVVRVFLRKLYGPNFPASISAFKVKILSVHVVFLVSQSWKPIRENNSNNNKNYINIKNIATM